MITDSQKWLWLVLAMVIAGLMYLLSPILTPFLIAMLLAYMGDPVADKLEEKGCSRTLAVVICFAVLSLVFILAAFFVIPVLIRQLAVLAESLPQILVWLKVDAIPWINLQTGMSLAPPDWSTLKEEFDWARTGGVLRLVLSEITSSSMAILALIANLFLIPVVTFYLLRDWDILVAKVSDLFPRASISVVSTLAKECHQVLAAFMQGQLLVMASLASIYSIGLMLIGLKLGLIIGLLAGLASIVPYMGLVVGLAAAAIAAFFQFGDVLHMVLLLLVFGVGQALEGMVLTPKLVGDRIGLHPVAVIFAVLAGGQLFGFFGILLALPIAAVIMVLLRHVHDLYRDSGMYNN
jgi:predicted PurR-regulated permease PerM